MTFEWKDWIIPSFIIIVALAAGCLSAWQYMENGKADKEISILQKELINSQSNLINKTNQLTQSQQETSDKADLLIEAQQESSQRANDLIAAQAKLLKMSTGGDSYPLFSYDYRQINDGSVDFMREYIRVSFVIKGEYSLIDAEFEHLDVSQRKNQNETQNNRKLGYRDQKEDFDDIHDPAGKSNYSIGNNFHYVNLSLPKLNIPTPKTPSPDAHKTHKYKMITKARNGVFIQETTLNKSSGYWVVTDVKITLKYNGEEEMIINGKGNPYEEYKK